ncbi:MAG: antibiotic biosynthesis monooxygenase [Flavobacteriales bacterium]|nr:antibiotic biosynthesis monooxygenase [Flavobacteriales bacterium]
MNKRYKALLLFTPALLLSCQTPEAPAPEAPPPPVAVAEPAPAVIVTIRFQCQPGRGDDFLAAAKGMLAEVRNEPHFLGITILRDQNDADRIVFHERWADKDYYLGPHDATPHLGAFKEAAMPLLAGPPEIVLWDRFSELTMP